MWWSSAVQRIDEIDYPRGTVKGQERVFARILMISFRRRYRKHEAKISVTSSG
jgi:hypothetical protein